MDTQANIRAFDAATGAVIFTVGVGAPKDRRGGISLWTGESTGAFGVLFGGGVSYANGRLYATSGIGDRKSTRLNSSHANISYAVFCLKKKKTPRGAARLRGTNPKPLYRQTRPAQYTTTLVGSCK